MFSNHRAFSTKQRHRVMSPIRIWPSCAGSPDQRRELLRTDASRLNRRLHGGCDRLAAVVRLTVSKKALGISGLSVVAVVKECSGDATSRSSPSPLLSLT